MAELWDICLSNRALMRCLQEKLPATATKASKARKSSIFLVSPKRASHYPVWVLAEALLEQAPAGCLILLQEQKSCCQAVRRDGNLPRDEKEAEMFLEHVQLAADIAGVPGRAAPVSLRKLHPERRCQGTEEVGTRQNSATAHISSCA